MATSERHALWQYDIFISYQRKIDELHPFIAALKARIETTFLELTGFEARIFVDSSEIATAMLWQTRIESALAASATMIVIETPSYYNSEWCQRELDKFLILEQQRRRSYQLLPYEALIFPVRRTPMHFNVPGSDLGASRAKEISERQSTDLVDIAPGSREFAERVDNLLVGIISVLQKMMQPDFSSLDMSTFDRDRYSQLALTTPLVTTYAGADDSKMLQLLVDAEAVTMVGLSHQGLAEVLEKAIQRRRQRYPFERAFWDHLNIVFLADDLLPYVRDGLSIEFPDKLRAQQERARRHAWSRRRIMSLMLRDGVPGRWTLYSYPYSLPFQGAVFAMPDGRRVVQLRMMRPSRQENDYLSIEFIDRVDQFFESTFQEVVDACAEEHEIVLIGSPGTNHGTFICRGSRYRRSVLIEGRNISDWLAAIVAITWRRGRNGVEPLLQVNTPRNSTREIGKASHVSGYINYRDYASIHVKETPAQTEEYVLPDAAVLNALKRELQDDFGLKVAAGSTELVGSANFYYPDKENIYFYLLRQEIDATYKFATDTQMFAWTLDELLTVRRHHVLLNTLKALTTEMTQRQRTRACEIVRLNLLAQGDEEFAVEVSRFIANGDFAARLKTKLMAEIENSRIYKYDLGRELGVEGIAGLQYRVFYSALLPAYAEVGVRGAEEEMNAITQDSKRSSAAEELALLYDDEDFVTSFTIEV